MKIFNQNDYSDFEKKIRLVNGTSGEIIQGEDEFKKGE